jgi:hypothetical protein
MQSDAVWAVGLEARMSEGRVACARVERRTVRCGVSITRVILLAGLRHTLFSWEEDVVSWVER